MMSMLTLNPLPCLFCIFSLFHYIQTGEHKSNKNNDFVLIIIWNTPIVIIIDIKDLFFLSHNKLS